MVSTQGSRVKEVRKYFKLSQEDLADKIGIRQSSVSQIEKDGSASAETLLKISAAYGVNIGWLMEGIGDMLIKEEKAEPKNDGAIFLSATTLYSMWQDSERKAREERAEMIKLMVSQSDQITAMREQISEKDALIKTTLKKLELKVSS